MKRFILMLATAGLRWSVAALVCVGIAADISAPLGAQFTPPRRIVGRVRRLSDSAVKGADVTLTVVSPRRVIETTSDSSGRFSFDAPGEPGEYILTVVSSGFRPIRRRIANENASVVMSAEVTLITMATELPGVSIVARVSAPDKRFVYEIGTGGLEAAAQGSRAAMGLTLDRFTDALRANLFVDPSGILGLPATESQTQLNGLAFFGDGLPRSLPVSIKAGIGDYDIGIGGFSSGRIAVDLMPAGEFAVRSGVLTADRGAAGQPVIPGAGGRAPYTVAVDAGGTNRWNDVGLSWGVRGKRSTASNGSLAELDSTSLKFVGLNPTLTARTQSIAVDRGLWLGRGLPSSAATTALSGAVRFDPTLSRLTTNAFVAVGSTSASQLSLANMFAAPQQAIEAAGSELTVQHLFRRVDASRAAWDIRTSVSGARRTSGSPSAGAVANVIVRPRETLRSIDDAPSLLIGGPGPRRASNLFSAESMVERESFVGSGDATQRKMVFGARSRRYSQTVAGPFASIAFPSVNAFDSLTSALVSLRPASGAHASTQGMTAGVGQTWRVSPTLKVTAGVRGDYQRLSTQYGAFRGVDLSPRLGLTWNFAAPSEGAGFVQTNLLTRQLVPPGVLRLGAGVFVGELSPDLGAQPAGVDPQIDERSCVLGNFEHGWTDGALSSKPLADACLAGLDGPLLTSMRSTSSLAPGFRPPRSTRATASLVTRWKRLDFMADGVVAFNDRQPRVTDSAVPGLPFWTIGADANRSFFAPFAAIRDVDGSLLPGRVVGTSTVGRALVVRSTQHSVARRLLFQVGTKNGGSRTPVRIGYAIGSVRSDESGWDRDAFGSPWTAAWGPAKTDRRHQVQAEIGRSFYGVSVSAWARLSSGLPFTPLVQGDVNGDGNAGNDRAVVPGGVASTTGEANGGLQSFMNQVPSYARHCLREQAGQPARRGSCRGPANATSGLYIAFNPGAYLAKRGFDVVIAVDNWLPGLGAVGRPGAVDPILLRVQRFDVATSSFAYSLNPNFGRQVTMSGIARGGSRVTLSATIPLAPEIQEQQLDRWLARNGVGKGLSQDSLAGRFARNVPNLYTLILSSEDDLGLSDAQRATLNASQSELTHMLWRVWSDLASALVAMGARQSSRETLALVQAATDRAWEESRLSAHRLRTDLTPVQESLLPWPAKSLVRSDQPVHFKVLYY